ncbi:PR-1-like protein [Coprinopsis marcescibilis]|uniref:PR-1-like protein n=1 Tax=Coprinopsis marcescibilis TaxID=230819 RepID=A0A5C3LDA0_COPMA|nr:PR-1-like protein [Coprinopsis marcescibilis]
MARFAALVTFVAAAALIPSTLAGPLGALTGPACAQKNRGLANCLEKCKNNWGWVNGRLGSNPWGSVVVPPEVVGQLDAYIAQACGESSQASPTPAPTIVEQPPINAVPIPTTRSVSSSSSRPVSTSARPSSSSSSSSESLLVPTASSSAANVAPSSTVAFTPEPVVTPTSEPPPPPPPPTTERPRVVPTTQAPPPPPSPTPTPAPAPAPAPPQQPNNGGGGNREEWLSTHNAARARHGANPLSWDDRLEAAAQRWANNCVFEHSGGSVGAFGENLAAGTGSYPPTSALDGWYREVSDYNPSNPQFSHFTQVVWKASTRLGCATAICTNGMIPGFGNRIIYHVCEYDPPGNFQGRFAENVQV